MYMIPKGLLGCNVSSRKELIAAIYHELGDSLSRVIDTHNTASIIFVYKDKSGLELLLKAEFGTQTATHREIGWYKLVEGWPFRCSARLLDSYQEEGYALLLLEFIADSLTLDDLALTSQASSEKVMAYVEKAIDFDRKLFDATAISISPDTMNRLFIDKYRQRRREAKAIPYLADLFALTTVSINGQNYYGPDVIMGRIEKSPFLLKLLTPQKAGLIHGDLHAGNVLTKGDDIFLIDPNGDEMMPIEYDIGKMLHSIHGNYGSIMSNDYNLTVENKSTFRFDIRSVPVYDIVRQGLKKNLSKDEYIRSLYAEALHFVTMLPHHASDRQETTALFLQSTLLFGALIDMLGRTGSDGMRLN